MPHKWRTESARIRTEPGTNQGEWREAKLAELDAETQRQEIRTRIESRYRQLMETPLVELLDPIAFPYLLDDFQPPTQREKIRKARADKRALLKKAKPTIGPPDTTPNSKSPAQLERTMTKALTKLRRILYLQSGNCFFCGKPLAEEDASVEHLNPKSRGGTNSADNEVVCHKTLNEVFGNSS